MAETIETTEKSNSIELNQVNIDRGYKSCHSAVKGFFRNEAYVARNLPGEKRKGLNAVLSHTVRSTDLLDLEGHDGLSLDVWSEIRDELSDALCGCCSTVELAALADAKDKHDIPTQHLFDILEGADHWIRQRKFDTYDELETFASRMGGATMAAAIPVLGLDSHGDHESAANKCGQAVFLTSLLANFVNDVKHNKNFMPQKDIAECEIVLHRVKLRQPSKPFTHFARLMCSRIEKLFYGGGELVQHLDFDGQRTVKALLELNWMKLMKIKQNPDVALSADGVLTRGEMFGLKSRQLMGLEGKIPCIPEDAGHGHH